MRISIIFSLIFSFLFSSNVISVNIDDKQNHSEYPFMDVDWIRDGEQDLETLSFSSNGHFSYFCSCGNPVNDSDLCETYTYNESRKEFNLNCYEKTNETVTRIKLVDYDDENLILDFDGEIRKFTKE